MIISDNNYRVQKAETGGKGTVGPKDYRTVGPLDRGLLDHGPISH